MTYDYDLIVIGAGAAGLTAAGIAASFGVKTALIEKDKLGGDCTWYGCIPSKTLLKVAKVAHTIRTASDYGFESINPEFDYQKVLAHVHAIQAKIYQDADAPHIFEKMGIEVITGAVTFVDAHAIDVVTEQGTSKKLTAKYYLIATGSSPIVPDINGIDQVPYLTNETIFTDAKLPNKLLIIGSGPIGIEMAQAFNRLGSQVTVIDPSSRILRQDDAELAELLKEQLTQEGIHFMLDHRIESVEGDDRQVTVHVKHNETGELHSEMGDKLFVAAGRAANIKTLNLAAAGIATHPRGIVVNRQCRTSQKHIYAGGDVAGGAQFTHLAEHMAKVAVLNFILKIPSRVDSKHVPWCTFTDPELAHVGLTEKALKKTKLSYATYRFPFSKVDRAITDSSETGWIKVFAKKSSGKIYGVTILGPNAGDLICEYALAMKQGISLRKIADTIHPYPTLGLANRRAADQWYVRKQSRLFVRILQRLFGYRGSLPDTSDPERII